MFQQFDSLSYETTMHAMRNLLIRIFYSNIDVTKYKINISVSRLSGLFQYHTVASIIYDKQKNLEHRYARHSFNMHLKSNLN